MAALAGSFSVLMGWLAVWNFRRALGMAPSPGSARQSAPETYDPSAVRAAGSAAAWDARATPAGHDHSLPSGGSTVICYDRAKVLGSAAGLACVCLLLAAILTGALRAQMHPVVSPLHPAFMARPHANSPLLVLLLVAALGYYVWQLFGFVLRGTDKDLTAVSWDSRQIKVRSLVWSRQVPWVSFESISLKRKTFRLFRVIPIFTRYALVFRLRHDGASRLMQIPASELNVNKSALPELMRKIELCRARYVCSTFGGAEQPQSERAPVQRAQGFETNYAATTPPSAFGRKAS
jgi:hypothetical protein